MRNLRVSTSAGLSADGKSALFLREGLPIVWGLIGGAVRVWRKVGRKGGFAHLS